MKRIKCIVLSAAVFAASILSGCNSAPANDETSSESQAVAEMNGKAEISEVRRNFSEDSERLLSKDYDNLFFKDTAFSFPQIDEVCTLTLTPLTGKSADEIYEFFCQAVDLLTDNKYTDNEKKYEIRFVDGGSNSDLPYPYNCPDIDEYKNGLETEYPWPTIDNEDYFIDMMYGTLRGFDNGALIEYDQSDHPGRSMYFMINQNQKHRAVFYTEDLSCTDTYRLVNGEISIADAAKFAQNYLDNLKFTPYDGNIPTPRIIAVNVVDIGGDCYGYNFVTTVEYKGVNFDYRNKKGNDVGTSLVQTDYDKRSYNSATGSIDMIETDKIHHFLNIANGVEITEGEPQTSIITLEAAADSISKFFSGTMKFSVEEVSMVWLPTKTPNELKTEHAYPCWKFKLRSGSELYHTFVDMLTGEIYLYVQAV